MGAARGDLRPRGAGFTLIEIALTLAVVACLSSIAIVNYFGYVEKARVARAVAEIESIGRVIDALMTDDMSRLPDSLADIEAGHMIDPWGNPYRYLKIAGGVPPGVSRVPGALPSVAAPPVAAGPSVIAQARKDQFLVPINSDYDLYSLGADGKSKPNLNTPVSHDDVIRARDGAYVGLAELF